MRIDTGVIVPMSAADISASGREASCDSVRISGVIRFAMFVIVLWALLSACAASLPQVEQVDLSQARRDFVAARTALRTGDAGRYTALAALLQDYPLATYLEYDRLARDIKSVNAVEVTTFLNKTPSEPLNQRLRSAWIFELARREAWQDLMDTYRPTDDLAIRCLQFNARQELGRTAELWDETKSVWLVGKEAPRECEDPYRQFQSDPRTLPVLIWQKAQMALENGNTDLALRLAERLDPTSKNIVQLWAAVIKHPESVHDRAELLENRNEAREIAVHAVKLLAKRDFRQAQAEWHALHNRAQFTAAQVTQVDKSLAIAAAQILAPEAKVLLDALPATALDATVQASRLRVGIAGRDWAKLSLWLQEAPAPGMDAGRWRYWRARAAELRGDNDFSQAEFRSLANPLDYYGRLAQERRRQNPGVDAAIKIATPERLAAIALRPGILRARELYFSGFMTEARAEWSAAIQDLAAPDLEAAATLAADWNWLDRSIATLAKVPQNRDLRLRFPQPFREQVMLNADRMKVDPALIYGVMRTESLFMEDAQSRAGALGLMQLMPNTGKETAAHLGVALDNTGQLLMAQTNIPLGTSYLARVLNHFHGNTILAIAAYNAGPARVDSWRPLEQCEPAEYWIETIPYSETSGYVRNVLLATSIYRRNDEQTAMPLTRLLAQAIAPQAARGMATSGCELVSKDFT
jgi:soluble lytic murein transglycosylase